jgi:hypothetical protein
MLSNKKQLSARPFACSLLIFCFSYCTTFTPDFNAIRSKTGKSPHRNGCPPAEKPSGGGHPCLLPDSAAVPLRYQTEYDPTPKIPAKIRRTAPFLV